MNLALFSLTLLFTFVSGSALASAEQCFVRKYTDQHLAKNPRQMVRSIKLVLNEADGFTYVSLKARHKDEDAHAIFGNGGACDKLSSGTLECGLDEDSGHFRVQQHGSNVLIEITTGLRLFDEDASEDDESQDTWNLAPGKDNGVFKLESVEMKNCTI